MGLIKCLLDSMFYTMHVYHASILFRIITIIKTIIITIIIWQYYYKALTHLNQMPNAHLWKQNHIKASALETKDKEWNYYVEITQNRYVLRVLIILQLISILSR